MVNYLSWTNVANSAITAVSPFTYRDGVTYLEKLEAMGAKVNELVDVSNATVAYDVEQTNHLNAQYSALVADWNATLATLDPAAVSVMLTGYQAQLTGIGNRVTTIENKNYDAVIATNSTSDRAYADTKKTEAIASANSYTDTKDTAARAYTDTKSAAERTYTNGAISGLSSVYEAQANMPADVRTNVANGLSSANAMRDALDARYALYGSMAWPSTGRAGGVYYLSAYCNAAQKAGTASASSAIAQIITDMTASNGSKTLGTGGKPVSGGTIVIDGYFLVDQSIPVMSGLSLIGTGFRSSGFRIASNISLVRMADNSFVEGLVCDNFGVDIEAAGGCFLEMTGTDGGSMATSSALTKSAFTRLRLVTRSTTRPIVSLTGYSQYHANQWFSFEMDRPTASIAPLFLFNPNAGNVMNSNSIRGGWLHGHNTTGSPAIILTPSAAGWMHNWTLEDLCGEQNCGGLIDARAVNHLQIRNCVDWDGLNTYTKSVIRVGRSTSNTNSANVVIESSGVPYDLPVYGQWIEVDNGTTNSNIRGCNPAGTVGKIKAGDMTRVDGVKAAFRGVTANYTASVGDETLMLTAAGITVTLPDPLTIPNIGVTIHIVNVANASSTIVVANGRTVAGGASLTLAAGASVRLFTEGQYVSGSGAAMRWIAV